MVSSFDLFFFSEIISGVMKGLRRREEQETVLEGACLSRIEERVLEKTET